MGRRQIPLAGADDTRAPVMTIAMFHEVRAAQDRLAAGHTLQQPFGLSRLCL